MFFHCGGVQVDQSKWLGAIIVMALLSSVLSGTLVTKAQCSDSSIETFTVSPSTTTVDQGTWLEVYGRGNCGTSRITIDGESKAEHGGPEISTTIKTEEFSAGSHTICYLLRDDSDGWQGAARRCTMMTFRAVNQPTRTTAGMPGLNEYCQSLGYNRGSFPNSNQAYSATCADGNRVHTIDMNAVCRWRYNDELPYAGLADHQSPSTWSCNARPAYIDPQDPPRNNGGGSTSNNNNGNSGGNTSNSSNNQPQNNSNAGGNSNTGTNQGNCPSAASRVSVGSQVTVSDADPSPLPMRSGAGSNHGVISNIPVRTRLTISAGPVCADGFWWWQIEYQGVTGWTVEGDSEDNWIENVSSDQEDIIYPIRHADDIPSVDIDSDYLGDGWLKYEVEGTYSIRGTGYFLRTVTVFFKLDAIAQAQLYCWAVADVAIYDQSGNVIAEETGLSLGLLTVSEGESQVDLAIFEHIGSSGRIDIAFLYSCAGRQTPPQSIAPNETNLRNMILPPTSEIFYVSITIP